LAGDTSNLGRGPLRHLNERATESQQRDRLQGSCTRSRRRAHMYQRGSRVCLL
jgi:hypothetical protein